MPIYEYQCAKCGVFEHTQRITEPALAKCPRCKRKVQRLISNTSFQLKGSGWYVTDYAGKGKGKGKDAKSDGGSSDTSSSSGDAKSSDSKSSDSKSGGAKKSSSTSAATA